MLAQTHLKQQLDALRHSTVSGFVRLRVAANVDLFPGWLAAQTLYPRLSASQLRSARRLLHHKGRQLSGEFLAEGAQAVREALKVPGAVRLLIVDDPVRHQELLETAGDVPVAQASPEQIATLSDTVNSQGVFAVCVQHTVSLADLSSHAAQLVVICAQVRDPGNAGTVVRCADAFGAEILELCVALGGTVTGEHGVGIEKINSVCVQYSEQERDAFFDIKRAFDPPGLLNPGKAIPTLARCAEYGRMHIRHGRLNFPELPRF